MGAQEQTQIAHLERELADVREGAAACERRCSQLTERIVGLESRVETLAGALTQAQSAQQATTDRLLGLIEGRETRAGKTAEGDAVARRALIQRIVVGVLGVVSSLASLFGAAWMGSRYGAATPVAIPAEEAPVEEPAPAPAEWPPPTGGSEDGE